MDSNQLSVVIKAVFEKSGVTKELSEIQKIAKNNTIKIIPELETASIKNNLKQVSNEIAKTLNQSLGKDFKVTGNDVFKILNKELNETSSKSNKMATELSRLSKVNTMQKWADNNSKAMKKYGNEINDIIQKMGNLDVALTKDESESLTAQFKNFQNQAIKTGNVGKTAADKFKSAWDKLGGLSLATSGLLKLWDSTKDAIFDLKEIDTLLTEISKANDSLSNAELSQIGKDSFDIASKYGKTATDYLSAVQETSRAGYKNAEGLAELSTAAQGAGDMTADLANQYIIATDKAFKMNGSVQELTKTLDGANYITNNNAVNMTELAEGISVVGSQAASSQMDIDETTAAIGTMIAVTQKSGSEMGNAFKGILMNLQQVTGEVDDGENAIDETSLTKYEKACEALGVSLSTVKDGVVSLKEPMQILKELSTEYTKLDESDAKRANLLSAVGGKYRANALNAILENYDLYEEMLQQYADGTGSMAEEAQKTANSWEGSMNRLSNTWTSVVSNVADSDAITTGINALNGLLGIVEKLTSGFNQLNSFLSSGLGFLGEGNSSFGTLGAISGLLMNKAGIGERTMF